MKCSLACSCSYVYFSGNYSDCVCNEQSKNRPLHLPVSTTNTFAEPSLGREAKRCNTSSCSYVYFSAGNYSDYVWNEQSKNHPLCLGGSTTNTFAELRAMGGTAYLVSTFESTIRYILQQVPHAS